MAIRCQTNKKNILVTKTCSLVNKQTENIFVCTLCDFKIKYMWKELLLDVSIG